MWTLFLLLLWTSRLQRVVLLVQIVDAGCGCSAFRGVSERTTSGAAYQTTTLAAHLCPLVAVSRLELMALSCWGQGLPGAISSKRGNLRFPLVYWERIDRMGERGRVWKSKDRPTVDSEKGNRRNSKHMNNVGLAYVLKRVLHFDLCERLRTMASFVVF